MDPMEQRELGEAFEGTSSEVTRGEEKNQSKSVSRPLSQRPYAKHIPSDGGADQAHRAGCDINVIVKQMENSGHTPHIQRGEGVFGDFSSAPTLHEAYELVLQASEAFEELPSGVRSAAMNSPVQLLQMLEDPYGLELLTQAGLDVVDEVDDDQAGETPPQQPQNPAQDSAPAEPDPNATTT